MSVRSGIGTGTRQARLLSLMDADTSDVDTLRICPCMHFLVHQHGLYRTVACHAYPGCDK